MLFFCAYEGQVLAAQPISSLCPHTVMNSLQYANKDSIVFLGL